jgi:hypothetical protein
MPFPMAPFRGKRVAALVTPAAVLLAASLVAQPHRWRRPRRPRSTVTDESPGKGNHGKWRWKVKTDRDRPPADIPADQQVTPSDIAA